VLIDAIAKADKVGLTYGNLPVSTCRPKIVFFYPHPLLLGIAYYYFIFFAIQLREASLTVYNNVRPNPDVVMLAAGDPVPPVFTARGGPVTDVPPVRRRRAKSTKRAPELSEVPQIQPFIADVLASISDGAQKATVSKAIKDFDHALHTYNCKIEAQQAVIDEAQNDIRKCQASIQTAQKDLIHQISAILQGTQDAGEEGGRSTRADRATRRAEVSQTPIPLFSAIYVILTLCVALFSYAHLYLNL
jgi:hypothetical protein